MTAAASSGVSRECKGFDTPIKLYKLPVLGILRFSRVSSILEDTRESSQGRKPGHFGEKCPAIKNESGPSSWYARTRRKYESSPVPEIREIGKSSIARVIEIVVVVAVSLATITGDYVNASRATTSI